MFVNVSRKWRRMGEPAGVNGTLEAPLPERDNIPPA
jgi:hypothetical protein